MHFGGGSTYKYFSPARHVKYIILILLTQLREYDIDIILYVNFIRFEKKWWKLSSITTWSICIILDRSLHIRENAILHVVRLWFRIVARPTGDLCEGTNHRNPPVCTCFFSSQSRKILPWLGEKCGWMWGRCQERSVGDWQALHTRAICTTTITWNRPRRVPAPVSIREKTHVRGSRSWSVVCSKGTARIPPFFSPPN